MVIYPNYPIPAVTFNPVVYKVGVATSVNKIRKIYFNTLQANNGNNLTEVGHNSDEDCTQVIQNNATGTLSTNRIGSIF